MTKPSSMKVYPHLTNIAPAAWEIGPLVANNILEGVEKIRELFGERDPDLWTLQMVSDNQNRKWLHIYCYCDAMAESMKKYEGRDLIKEMR